MIALPGQAMSIIEAPMRGYRDREYLAKRL